MALAMEGDGRGERIRTSGLYVPNVALYQAKLHPEVLQIAARQNDRSAAKVANCSKLVAAADCGSACRHAIAARLAPCAFSRA